MDDLTSMTDADLDALAAAISQERQRRQTLADAPAMVANLTAQYLTAREDGGLWVAPTGSHDAYPEGWQVTHDGKTWVSLTPANVWPPGVSGWREVPAEGDDGQPAVPEWVAPTGAQDAYAKGDRVTFQGQVWESALDGNTWSPADYPAAWTLIS